MMSFGVPWSIDVTGLKSFLVMTSFLLAITTRHASLVSRAESQGLGQKLDMVESANDHLPPPEEDRWKELFQADDSSYDADEYDGEDPDGLDPVLGVQKTASRSTESGGHGYALAGGAPVSFGEETMSRLPQAIIIGVKKGGTRALLEFLRVHPKVRAPGPEVHFFDRHYDKGIDWYRALMPPTTVDQTTIEKTPSYFVTKSTPARVYNMSRSVRLIVVVRDPVTRAVSDYTQVATKRRDQRSFAEMAFLDNATGPVATSWGAIKIGLYAKHLERWLAVFPRVQLHFVNGERLIDSPAAEMGKIEDFLGLGRFIAAGHFYFNATKGFPCLLRGPVTHCLGKTKGRLHPSVDEKILRRLRSFYRPFNEKFYQMTGINFGWS